jgi:hypothetical protein
VAGFQKNVAGFAQNVAVFGEQKSLGGTKIFTKSNTNLLHFSLFTFHSSLFTLHFFSLFTFHSSLFTSIRVRRVSAISFPRIRARKNVAGILPTHPTQHQHPNVSGFRRPHPFYCGNEKIDYVLL